MLWVKKHRPGDPALGDSWEWSGWSGPGAASGAGLNLAWGQSGTARPQPQQVDPKAATMGPWAGLGKVGSDAVGFAAHSDS